MNNTNLNTLKEALNKELNTTGNMDMSHNTINTITESVDSFLSNSIQNSNN